METQFILNAWRSAEDSYASGIYSPESVVITLADNLDIESGLFAHCRAPRSAR